MSAGRGEGGGSVFSGWPEVVLPGETRVRRPEELAAEAGSADLVAAGDGDQVVVDEHPAAEEARHADPAGDGAVADAETAPGDGATEAAGPAAEAAPAEVVVEPAPADTTGPAGGAAAKPAPAADEPAAEEATATVGGDGTDRERTDVEADAEPAGTDPDPEAADRAAAEGPAAEATPDAVETLDGEPAPADNTDGAADDDDPEGRLHGDLEDVGDGSREVRDPSPDGPDAGRVYDTSPDGLVPEAVDETGPRTDGDEPDTVVFPAVTGGPAHGAEPAERHDAGAGAAALALPAAAAASTERVPDGTDDAPADDEPADHPDLDAPHVPVVHARGDAASAPAAEVDLIPEATGRRRGRLAAAIGAAVVIAYGVGYVANGIFHSVKTGHWPMGLESFLPWQWFSAVSPEAGQPPQTATSTPTPTTPPTTAPPPPVVVDPGPVVDPARAVENVSVGEWGGPQSDPTHAHTYPGTPTWAVVEYAQQHNLTLAEAGAAPGTVDPRSDAFQAALANVMNFNGLTAREATQLADGSSLQMSADILAGTAK
jgi:hypothetical protein